MKLADLINELLDSKNGIQTTLDDIRNMPVSMTHKVSDGQHTMVIIAMAAYTFTPDEKDRIHTALENALLARHVVTVGVFSVGDPSRTAYSFYWRPINRANIFILPEGDRRKVKAWLERIPKPKPVIVEPPGFWGG